MAPLGTYHLIFFGLLIPYLAIRSHARLKASTAPLDRVKHFRSTAIMLVVFGTFSLVTARYAYVPLRILPSTVYECWNGLLVAVPMYFAAVLFMRPRWRKAVEQRKRVVHLFMPENATERAWWVAVSVLAGISEEITWRGVQSRLLIVALHGFLDLAGAAAAMVVCAVMFGVAHYMQGWRTAVIVTLFAIGFQIVVLMSGNTLFLAMAVHIAYDITAGLTYGKLGKELGYSVGPGMPGPYTDTSKLDQHP